jgi:hypothetical protein
LDAAFLGVRMLRSRAGLSSRLRGALNGPFEQALTHLGARAATQQGRENRGVERNPTNCHTTEN